MTAQMNTLICVHVQLVVFDKYKVVHGSTKAHATMPIGFMGSNSLAPLD